MSHTPGPWTVESRAGLGIKGSDGMWVCTTHKAGVPELANATLIAAAPDLLAALKWVFASGALRYSERLVGQNDAWCDGIDLAREAIRKAEGKEKA